MKATLLWQADQIQCTGEFDVHGVALIDPKKWDLKSLKKSINIDFSQVEKIDTAGAFLFNQLFQALKQRQINYHLTGLNPKQNDLIEFVAERAKLLNWQPVKKTKTNPFHRLGELAVAKYWQVIDWLAFVGEIAVLILQLLIKPLQFQWRAFIQVIQITGFNALGIVGLLSFLIGVVLAYQLGLQLQTYGANIYIVYLVGLAVLREFAPLITAIIVAGRTGAAYTAEIGTMVINQEVDAIRTFGLSPVQRLALPKIFGLVVALPLLTIWADILGILGGMMMAKNMLGISYTTFLITFPQEIDKTTFFVGMVKTPIFALTISIVGCLQGFRVAGDAESIGRQTTKSVVQSIFMIVIIDALFSVYFSWQGI